MIDDIFRQRLILQRRELGLSQSKLHIKTGITQEAISCYECGKNMPNFHNLSILADALEVSVDYLMGRTDQKELFGNVTEKNLTPPVDIPEFETLG